MKPGDRVSADQKNVSYVAIIMDGNARWARLHGKTVLEGHRAGAKALKRIVRASVELGIKELTVYAFSTENWERPKDEVDGLMHMFAELITSETPELDEQGVRLQFIGRREGVDDEIIEKIEWAHSVTKKNSKMLLYVAFNYGGRGEIVDAAQKLLNETEGEAIISDAEALFAKNLYAPEMSDPELLIRTSGERRISNFLLWQCAYSEFHFTDTLWPEFGKEDLETALNDFNERKRRFGQRDVS